MKKAMKVILATCEDSIDQYLIKNESTMGIQVVGKVQDQVMLAQVLDQIPADVILMNRFIPGPVSVSDILEEIKKKGIRPILLLLGEGDEEVIQIAFQFKIYDFLIGKYGPKQIQSMIHFPNTREIAAQTVSTYYPTLNITPARVDMENSLFAIAQPYPKEESHAGDYPRPSNVLPNPHSVYMEQKPSTFQPVQPFSNGAGGVSRIAVFSQRGGVGKSNITVNIAAILQKIGRSTVIVDTDVHQGIIGPLLKVKTPFSVLDWINFPDELDQATIMQSLGKHRSGICCLPSPLDYLGQPLKEDLFQKIQRNLMKCFSTILIDTDGRLSKTNISILKEVDLVIYVMTTDSTAMERHKKTIDRMIEFGVQRERIRIILNDPHNTAAKGDAGYISQKMNPISVGILSYSRELQRCSEEGEPIVFLKEKDSFSKELKELITSWLQLPSAELVFPGVHQEKRWWFSFWKRRNA